jgi:RNA polymerase sigma-70 factor (ECF subfamily)
MISDNSLIQQVQHGDFEALGVLYDRHRNMVYRTALMITGDHHAADDLLQDVFLRLYRFAAHFDLQRPLEPWLYRMTTNLSYDWVKRCNSFTRSLEDMADWLVGSGRNTPYEAVEQRDEWAQVQLAVSSLSLNQRVVVVLYYLNDLSVQDIAAILEIPIGTVKSRLHYGRMALKRKLDMHKEIGSDLKYGNGMTSLK